MNIHKISLILALGIVAAIPCSAFAFEFDPNYILSDDELENPFALDRNQIQAFLDRGYLGSYVTTDADGVMRTATDIIDRAAQAYGISQKFLLVLLQKEQSLVEDDDPTQNQLDWATGYAVCDDCSKNDPYVMRWQGFGKQVNSAAAQVRDGYLEDIESMGVTYGKYGPGISIVIDDTVVTPANAATASLYAYTPHLHGNENFAEIWNRWFSLQYPTGSLLQVAGESGIYLIEYGYKRPIHSWSAFTSRFDEDRLIEVSRTVLASYPDGKPIDFPNYSLLKDEGDNIYLLVDDTLRQIDSQETFQSIGYSEDEIIQITNDELGNFEIGEDITATTAYPQGALMQLTTNGAYFYVENGIRHAIVDEAIIHSRWQSPTIVRVEPAVVEQYKEGEPLLFADGYLVKATDSPVVYIVSEEKLRPITTEQVFNSYGWSFGDVIDVAPETLALLPIGLDLKDVME
ncbi:MAG: hypothetical protein WC730_00385 [Patescibacteria group bacterium]|jgi:hypothetical protein